MYVCGCGYNTAWYLKILNVVADVGVGESVHQQQHAVTTEQCVEPETVELFDAISQVRKKRLQHMVIPNVPVTA